MIMISWQPEYLYLTAVLIVVRSLNSAAMVFLSFFLQLAGAFADLLYEKHYDLAKSYSL